MFKFFTQKKSTFPVTQKPIKSAKTTNEIIDEIHESFYTEVDKLLASAKIFHSLDTEHADLIEKHDRLKALGFNQSKEVQAAKVEIKRLNQLRAENMRKAELISAINYFSSKYPHYKFITEESVKSICEKYNLVYGPIGRYTGDVPDKNLEHIENFKIDENDECYVVFRTTKNGARNFQTYQEHSLEFEFINHSKYQEMLSENNRVLSNKRTYIESYKLPLEIVAPVIDFNMTNKEIKDFKISDIIIPDPVVLKPVIFNERKYYLVVTAWGQEASDDLILNPNHN